MQQWFLCATARCVNSSLRFTAQHRRQVAVQKHWLPAGHSTALNLVLCQLEQVCREQQGRAGGVSQVCAQLWVDMDAVKDSRRTHNKRPQWTAWP